MSGIENKNIISMVTNDENEIKEVTQPKSITIGDISKTILYISRGVELNQPRLLQRAIRQNASVRRYVTSSQLLEIVEKFTPPDSNNVVSSSSSSTDNMVCPTRSIMISMIEKIAAVEPVSEAIKEDVAILDGLSVNVKFEGIMDIDEMIKFSTPSPSSILPEVEVFILTLIVTTLLRHNLNNDAASATSSLIERIIFFNRRSLDLLASKAYFYLSLSYERINKLENIRPTLLSLYRTSCIRHDNTGQAMILNLLLRNYLHYNLIDQAQVLSSRAVFPENASNNQFCRYLYYMGRIQAIQLEYSNAYLRLDKASRKAPQDCGIGFTRIITSLTIIVQLLMGEIPERSIFNQEELRSSLKPYLYLTQAVRNGDLQQFELVMTKYGDAFKADKNYTLVQRLSHNVLKTGLRKLSIAYSHISLADIATKLRLGSTSAAEYICAKAIRDGVIEAKIDHETNCLTSVDVVDLYATEEPQKAFNERIQFCLDVHNEAVKSMRYPPDAYKNAIADSDKSKPDEKTIEELIKELEEDMED